MIINIIKSLVAFVVIVAITSIGYVVYKQGQEIALLKNGYKANNVAIAPEAQPIPPLSSAPKELQISTSLEKQVGILGQVSAIQGNLLTVEASVPDMLLLSKVDTSKPFSVSYIKKTYHVRIVSTTIFTKKAFSALKIGDTVSVTSATPVLAVDTFDAKELMLN